MADPARRRILDLLRQRPHQTGELVAFFEVSRFMVMKHLKVLVSAGLVLVERIGRVRWNHLNAAPIQEIYRRWIQPFDVAPADALLRLKAFAELPPIQSSDTPPEIGVPMEDSDFKVCETLVEVLIQAPREKVWQALVDDAASWWPKDYYVSAEGARFKIDARIGGHMWEDYGDGEGTIWATVTQCKKHEALRMSAEVWPEYGGPARTVQRYNLEDQDGGTLLRFRDTMYGRVTEGALKSMQAGWDYLLGKAFKDYVESGKVPPDESPIEC